MATPVKPGPKTVHEGQFKPGFDPRRAGAGRPKGSKNKCPAEIRQLLRDEIPERIKQLVAIADDKTAKNSDRIHAIATLLQYGVGTTVTETDTQGNDVPRGRLREDEVGPILNRIMSGSN